MAKTDQKVVLRRRRKRRIRAKMAGTAARPRLSVFRSAKHIYAQVVDDVAGRTLGSAGSNVDGLPELSGDDAPTGKRAQAARVGMLLASRCKAAGVEKVIFDRNGYVYHGRVRSLADGARSGGLRF